MASDARSVPERRGDAGAPPVSSGSFAAVRLEPGEDLILGLHRVREATGARALTIVTCVGSLTNVMIRHANRPAGTRYQGHFEITSLVGTIDPAGEHVHLTITDGEGRAYGGHLLPGSAVYTTAEIVLLILNELDFARAPCPRSGYDELVVTRAPDKARTTSQGDPA